MEAFHRIVQTLHPGYFDVVMATGIIAIAAHLEQMHVLELALTGLSIALLTLLCTLNLARLLWYPSALVRDLANFERGPGFFTMVAGFAIVGSQFLSVLNCPKVASALWIISLTLWACFNYCIFIEATINEHKPRFEEGINGGWLISVVATQSVAGLGAQLAGTFVEGSDTLFVALIMWLAGGMLYIWLIALIFYRFTFFPFRAENFMPPFWINMGAMAISALTGTTLVAKAHDATFLAGLLPFLKGLTILFWATATWWIPMLAILSCWQHLIKKLNRPYNLGYWSAVFPLGMYAVATYQLSQTVDLPFLTWIPRVFVYIAIISGLATFAAMVRSISLDRRIGRAGQRGSA